MLHLTDDEVIVWQNLGDAARKGVLTPDTSLEQLRPALRPALRFHIAVAVFAADPAMAGAWLDAGTGEEQECRACSYLAGVVRRYGGLGMPTVVFRDPRPYIHFTTVPEIEGMRHRFQRFAARTLAVYDRPVRFMDVGCGNGTLGIELLRTLRECAVIPGAAEIILIDPFPAMLETASKLVREAFPDAGIRLIEKRSENIDDELPHDVDIALCSLAIHHMPMERKRGLVNLLGQRCGDILLFEMNSDHDTPELGDPRLSFSVYQSYGYMIDRIFAHEAPLDIIQGCVDQFLLSEVISLLTQPRGVRTDYHMTAAQWRTLFEGEGGCRLAAMEFCLATGGVEFFGQHFRRKAAGT